MNHNFADALKVSGLTIYKLSKQSGVPYTVVHELASGKKDINRRPAETVARLAAVLGLSSEEIMNPVFYMDKVSGKYRGVHFVWKHEDVMKLFLRSRDFSGVIESKYNMNHQKDKKAYDAYTEICIDQELNRIDSEQTINRFLQKEIKNG